jgi:hypothetical protein
MGGSSSRRAREAGPRSGPGRPRAAPQTRSAPAGRCVRRHRWRARTLRRAPGASRADERAPHPPLGRNPPRAAGRRAARRYDLATVAAFTPLGALRGVIGGGRDVDGQSLVPGSASALLCHVCFPSGCHVLHAHGGRQPGAPRVVLAAFVGRSWHPDRVEPRSTRPLRREAERIRAGRDGAGTRFSRNDRASRGKPQPRLGTRRADRRVTSTLSGCRPISRRPNIPDSRQEGLA